MADKRLLIDGLSILNRAFYGLPDLTNAEGLHTGAVLGFLNILLRIIEEEQATHVAVAFDTSAPTFRHEMYEAYKGTRKEMPAELREQIPLMKEVLDAMGVARIECAGLEADDILGTLARRFEADGAEVRVLSGDRDLLQIATEKTVILLPHTKHGQTTLERFDAAHVEEVWGVTPAQFIDLKALMGDSSDNVPGVPKVGEKTAKELMASFQSIEGIYEHIEEITKKAVKASLIENRALCDLSKDLVTIKTDADFDFDAEAARVGELYTQDAYGLFKRLGFKKLVERYGGEGLSEEAKTVDVQIITTKAEAETFFAEAVKAETDAVGMHVLTDGKRGQLFYAVAVSIPNRTAVLAADGEVTEAFLAEQINALAGAHAVSAFHVKNMYDFFTPVEVCDASAQAVSEITDAAVWSHTFDTQVAAYLLNPLKNDYTPEDIASEYLRMTVPSYAERFGKKKIAEAYAEERDALLQYAGALSEIALRACPALRKRLEETGMYAPLFTEIEMPLTWVLHAMEKEGIIARRDALKEYGDALTGRIQELETSIHEEAGRAFNINSPKQLGEILFDEMHLPYAKKTKTGYSTAADVLDKLAPEYPFVKEILEYRGLTKLKSTYADGLAVFIEEDDRIHTIFHQTITATGRLSSADPNLQNIPTRTDLGRQIRKVFVPKEGCIFTDADYSQIELRILAHMSGDEELIAAYREGEDIHRITASKVFHVPFEEVTDLQRRNAKAVNFGIVYGISAFGLSEDLSISRKEATDYIEQYFATYPGIKQYLDGSVQSAKDNGYSVTLFGRRRPIPELKHSNFMQRQFGERVAMNAPIQGTAADIMKIAMLRVFFRLEKEGLQSRVLLQVHDELLIETVDSEKDAVARVLTEEMEQSADLKVRLIVDCHAGESWYEAK